MMSVEVKFFQTLTSGSLGVNLVGWGWDNEQFKTGRCAMLENKADNKIEKNALYSIPDYDAEIRRKQDRRKKASPGFAYISMVGWICRREKSRRKDEPFVLSVHRDFFTE